MPHRKRSHKRRASRQQIPNPRATSLQYNGPITSRAMKEEEDLMTTDLQFTGVITSTAGGVIDSNYNSDPASYSLSDWTSLAALYHEYRTLGLRVEFYPNNRYSKTTTNCTPMIVCVDRQSGGTLGSYQVAMNHASAKKVSVEDPWREQAKMQNAEEAMFISTSGTQALFWIKFYADNLTVSTQYGRAFVYLLIQFRGRK